VSHEPRHDGRGQRSLGTSWEGNETFYVELFGLSSNARFTQNRGIGTIVNGD